jgi:hypothetical protein
MAMRNWLRAMDHPMTNQPHLEIMRRGVVAGLAGGLAEVAWVSLYAGITGCNAEILARGVTTASGVSALLPGSPVPLGIGVHMVLAIMLGVALSYVWSKLSTNGFGSARAYPVMLAALAGVWAINFFVILPIVSPAFVHLVPYSVSLASKLLFGLAAAEAFRRQGAARHMASGTSSEARSAS